MAATEDYYGGNKGLQGARLGSRLSFRECVHACTVMSNSFATPWTEALQAPLSMGFPRQASWSGLPCPPPGDLPHPGMEPTSPVSYSGRWILYLPGKPQGVDSCNEPPPISQQSIRATQSQQQQIKEPSRNQGLIPGMSHKAESSQPPGVPPGGKSVLTAYLDGEQFLKIYSSL